MTLNEIDKRIDSDWKNLNHIPKRELQNDVKQKVNSWYDRQWLRELSESAKGTYHFSVCVCGGGGGFILRREEQKKGRFDKGGNKVWPKYGKGERNYEFVQGGNTFFHNLNV